MEHQFLTSKSNTLPKTSIPKRELSYEYTNELINDQILENEQEQHFDQEIDHDNDQENEHLDRNLSEEKSKPRSINTSKTSYSYSSKRSRQDKASLLNPSKFSKITKFFTIKDDGCIKRYYSENHMDENESNISDAKTDFMDNRKVEDEVLITGIRKFNLRPKQGIDYFIEQNIISERTPKAVAEFLYKESQNMEDKVNEHWQLDKKNIGLYLGDINDFNVEVLDEFVKLHNFKGIQYDNALRIFLEEFFLPGESQIIDRMMQKFAYHYCSQNKDVFSCPDTAYVLAFSIILLNTDLHNSRIKRKMTKEEFIKNNKGIDNGEDLPIDYLSYIYDNISQNEIKSKTAGDIELDTTKSITKILNDISYSFTNPNMEGWLYKRGGIGKKQWKKKWCLVANSCMYFFPNKSKEKTIGILPLCDLTVSKYEFESSSPSSNPQYIFNNIFKNFTKTRYYFIIRAKPKKEEMMKKSSAPNSPDDETMPNFAITDNNQKVLYSKHVNGRVIADIQDYYIFGVDTKEECEYWVYIIESQIHDSMAAYRSLAAVKRHNIIQKKDINELKSADSSDIDIIRRTSSEMSSATRIAKDNYLYNTDSTNNLRHHNTNSKTLVNEKGVNSFIKSSKERLNSTMTTSTDHTYENLSIGANSDSDLPNFRSYKFTDELSRRLSLEFSKIDLSPLKDEYIDDSDEEDSVLNALKKIDLSSINGLNDEDDDFIKSSLDDDPVRLALTKKESDEKLMIPKDLQRIYSDPNLLTPIGISSSPTPDDSEESCCSSSSSNVPVSPLNDYTFNIPSFSITLDTLMNDKEDDRCVHVQEDNQNVCTTLELPSENKHDNMEEDEIEISDDEFNDCYNDDLLPNYIYSTSQAPELDISLDLNRNKQNHDSTIGIHRHSLKNKSSCCDMNEHSSLTESTIKEFNESSTDERIPNLSSLEFSRFDIAPIPVEEKSFEEIKYDDCNGLFEGQSQIPKAELGDSKFIHEGDTTNNVLNGANLSAFLK